jgi:hypothetical protein
MLLGLVVVVVFVFTMALTDYPRNGNTIQQTLTCPTGMVNVQIPVL